MKLRHRLPQLLRLARWLNNYLKAEPEEVCVHLIITRTNGIGLNKTTFPFYLPEPRKP